MRVHGLRDCCHVSGQKRTKADTVDASLSRGARRCPSMAEILVLVGLPGSGKSSACAVLVGPHTYDEPWSIGATVAGVGPLTGPIRGVDGVCPGRAAGIPGAISAGAMSYWLASAPRSRVVADNIRFDLDALKGHRVRSIYIDTPQPVAAERRRLRGSRAMMAGWWMRCAHEVAYKVNLLKAERVDGLMPAAEVASAILNKLGWSVTVEA